MRNRIINAAEATKKAKSCGSEGFGVRGASLDDPSSRISGGVSKGKGKPLSEVLSTPATDSSRLVEYAVDPNAAS